MFAHLIATTALSLKGGQTDTRLFPETQVTDVTPHPQPPDAKPNAGSAESTWFPL